MRRLPIYLLLTLAALFFLLPLYIMLVTSFKTMPEIYNQGILALPRQFDLYAWRHAWSGATIGASNQGIHPFFINSFELVIPAVIISTAIGAINGYILTHWRFRGANIIFYLLLLGTVFPFQIILLPMAWVQGKLHIAGTLIPGLVMVHIIYGLAFTTLFFRNYYVSIPHDLVRAARVDGAGFFRIFWRVMLPLSTPIIMVTAIWQFTMIWNNFLFGVVFTNSDQQPVTVAINDLVDTVTSVHMWNVDMAAALIAAIPTLVVYLLAGKYFVRGLTGGAVKG
ncbi:carbohydrate ABC transporter permease [Acidithiobacillus sp. CV18-2]|uniref:Carbohydrate ABC transporter permease n=1 Tax=Igneacidithiobacillus copahuensis TaxID=2724909 RepID=A0AAE2YNM7_9PROT|nr:carbohydrate ABC transporter permease [Igneacidithiobacillus copahuensis]MBU2754578.1 carbohydrate ABC transporter permease [Acidithiobacillus sp. CV18-3]MBU2757260.1 carbohydrate ABC transporter permease [Acidithiobacillus sp. BN09-2]MBU2776829.1 carbohydrate ABC transporter permease [Acidithiobacillus sp. CV18-2]MBU2796423.1 carbohydrate ABC transporter permease [Acidithiobacillus sp. VAN18-2]MBU2799441.1 carbohydrate ABC transporter permease [Acidithiobacillus sp. VAN18-4]UTV81049.1 car